MADIEANVRRIVALSDVSTITKRMVRKEYKKLTGTDALSAVEMNIINSTLNKIILELAQKMQSGSQFDIPSTPHAMITSESNLDSPSGVYVGSASKSHLDNSSKPFLDIITNPQSVSISEPQLVSTKPQLNNASNFHYDITSGDCKKLQKENTNSTDEGTHSASKQRKRQMDGNQNEPGRKLKSGSHYNQKLELPCTARNLLNNNATYRSTEEKSFVLAHQISNTVILKSRDVDMINRQTKPKLLTSSEALNSVLDSDFSADSGSDFFDSPQKMKPVEGKALEEADFNKERGRSTIERNTETSSGRYKTLELKSRGSNENMVPAKKYKMNENSLGRALAKKSAKRTLSTEYNGCVTSAENNVQVLDCEREAARFNKGLSSEMCVSTSSHYRCSKSGSLGLLEKNRQDCVTDATSPQDKCSQIGSLGLLEKNWQECVTDATSSQDKCSQIGSLILLEKNRQDCVTDATSPQDKCSQIGSLILLEKNRQDCVTDATSPQDKCSQIGSLILLENRQDCVTDATSPQDKCSQIGSMDLSEKNEQNCGLRCSKSDSVGPVASMPGCTAYVSLARINIKCKMVTDYRENPGHLKSEKKDRRSGNCKRKKRKYNVIDSSSDSETSEGSGCSNTTNKRQRYAAHNNLEKVELPVKFLESGMESFNGSSAKPVSEKEKMQMHCHSGDGSDMVHDTDGKYLDAVSDTESFDSSTVKTSDSLVQTERREVLICCNRREDNGEKYTKIPDYCSQQDFSSDDSFALSIKVRRRKRLKNNRQSFIDNSDCEHDNISSQKKNILYSSPRRCGGEHVNVMMKVVDGNNRGILEIKSAVVNDLDVLENLESRVSKKLLVSRKKLRGKSRPSTDNKGQGKKQKMAKCSRKVKSYQREAQKSNLSMSDLSSDSDDDDDAPLSLMRSGECSAPGKNYSKSCIGVTKYTRLVVKWPDTTGGGNNSEKNSSNGDNNLTSKDTEHDRNGCSESDNLKVPSLKICSSDSESSSVEPCALTATEGTLRSKIDILNPAIDVDVSTSNTFIPRHESNSDDTSSSLSDISDSFCPQLNSKCSNVASMNKKTPSSSELSRLRGICRKVGLFLRNTKELAGCDTDGDKVKRIKQLLQEKGMKGRPSLQKAEKLNLLKEMKELECQKVTSNNLEKDVAGGRRRQATTDYLGSPQNSPGGHGISSNRSIPSVFSNLKCIVSLDDSDSS